MLCSIGSVVRSIGKFATAALGVPNSAILAALRVGLWATPYPERRLLPNATAGVLGCSKALASTYAGRVGLGLRGVHGSSAAVLPAGTLPGPLIRPPTQLFSTSTDTGTSEETARAKRRKRGAAVAPSAVLVKVGDGGKYLPFSTDGLMGKNISELLEALAFSKLFGLKFKDIDLSGCSAFAFKLPAGMDEPTAADEADASKFVELKGAKTVDIAAGSITKDDQICIRVRLPTTATLGRSAILNPQADIKDVIAEVQPLAKAAIEAAAAHRAALSKLEILRTLRVGMTAAEARDAGVQVLREDERGVLTVGSFTIPRLDSSIVQPPLTFDECDEHETTLLLLPQRIERAMELVDAAVAGRNLATHLSGPYGIGKTAVLLLAYLILVARGVPAVFISRTTEWVDRLQADPTSGDVYFLECFWRQNADLIVKSPALRAVFADVLTDQPSPFGAACMPQLRRQVFEVLRKGKDSSKLDEVQNITKAVTHSELKPFPNDALARAGQYFGSQWHAWNNGNFAFQRLTAASDHSLRDYNLPDGEKHRLRFIEPLADADRDALLASSPSPAYVRSVEARKHVVYAAGSVLRALVAAARLLPAKGKVTDAHLSAMWDELWGRMVHLCQSWFDSLPSDAQRQDAADSVMSLLKGEQRWGSALVLYDAGIVCRSADATTSVVRPVSVMANAVLLHVTSAFQRGHRKRLSTINDAAVRGKAFEKQVLASFDPFQGLLPCKRLNGDGADAVFVRSSYSLPFHKLEEVVPRDRGVLYRPFDPNYPCDGIIIYVDEHGKRHIIIVECSVTDPCEEDSAKKVNGWFKGDGVVRKLQNMYPGAHIAILLCFSKALMKRATMTKYGELLYVHDPLPTSASADAAAPAAAVADIRVVDEDTLRNFLGVLI